MSEHVLHCPACLCLCAALIEQQLCVMAVIFIRAARSGMITIWVARFGLRITGHDRISKASPSPIMKPVMSDKNHLMEQRGALFPCSFPSYWNSIICYCSGLSG